MPDGNKLSDVLRTERRREQRREGSSNGKQAQADYVLQLQLQAKSGSSDDHAALSELRALEAVGARRRRRW
jgi:hypothetical protein